MYEGGYGMQEPIRYSPELRQNNDKSVLRIYGQAETGRVGATKLMWSMCPDGAPGDNNGCNCGKQFFDEPFNNDGAFTN
jgi:hypothetical protein